MNNIENLERGETVGKLDLNREFLFFEMTSPQEDTCGYEVAAEQVGPRTIKTHLPLCYWKDALDKSPGTKVIQTVRNPKDTLVSYYHFSRMNQGLGWFNGTWDQFFEMFKNDVIFGSDLFTRTADWYLYNENRENSLVLFYEDMKRDLAGNIKKLSKFLGKCLSDRAIELITEKSTFDNMSKDPNLNMTGIGAFKETRSKFMRKDQVGDWKDYFIQEQNEFIKSKCSQEFEPIGLRFEYD